MSQAETVHSTPSDFCWYCGTQMQDVDRNAPAFATRDHVIPRSQNGKGPGNYVDACRLCNNRKGESSLEMFRRAMGGGQFWGELFSPREVIGTSVRPPNLSSFNLWLALQETDRRDDWKFRARAAVALLSLPAGEPRGVREIGPTRQGPLVPAPARDMMPNRGQAPSSRTPWWHLRKALAVMVYGLAWKIDPEGAR